jgi:hypothetical protein
MPTKIRIILVSILILLGGVLFCYCAVFYPTAITTQAKAGSTTVTGLESAPVNATSIGAIERDKSGQVNQTRSEGRSRPRTGAT